MVGGENGIDMLSRTIRRIAVPLVIWEGLIKKRDEWSIRRTLANFPNLEEIVLVVWETDDEVLKRRDLEFVVPKEVPRSPVLMGLTMEMFQPWRAFADLFGVEMIEDALGSYVEEVRGGVAAGKEQRTGVDLLNERTVPKFKVREIRSARGAEG
jgi:hypothetical protein